LDTRSIPKARSAEQCHNWNTRLRGFKHSPIVGITKNLLPKMVKRLEYDFYYFSLLQSLRTDFYMAPAYWNGATANARSVLQDPVQFGAFLRMGADG
jgi:hypothetical protein